MADLTDIHTPSIIDLIYKSYEDIDAKKKRRMYLGGSAIGEECQRKIFYSFFWISAPKIPGRILRLFQTGHNEEKRIIQDLRNVGMTVYPHDPAKLKAGLTDDDAQWRFDALNGLVSGGFDGVLLGHPEAPKTWHLLECKTHNDKSYKNLIKNKVQKAKPVHYAQMQLYMRLGELTRALYISVNKNDDSIYSERIRYNASFSKALLDKAERIIFASQPPTGISQDQTFYKCKWCDYNDVCHGQTMPDLNCRTCCRCNVNKNQGVFTCELNEKKPLSYERQITGCGEHLFNPHLLGFCDPLEANEDETFIIYRNKLNDQRFINCTEKCFPAKDLPTYHSRELQNCKPTAIGDSAVELARTTLDGKVIK